jgi:predicted secreted protein
VIDSWTFQTRSKGLDQNPRLSFPSKTEAHCIISIKKIVAHRVSILAVPGPILIILLIHKYSMSRGHFFDCHFFGKKYEPR